MSSRRWRLLLVICGMHSCRVGARMRLFCLLLFCAPVLQYVVCMAVWVVLGFVERAPPVILFFVCAAFRFFFFLVGQPGFEFFVGCRCQSAIRNQRVAITASMLTERSRTYSYHARSCIESSSAFFVARVVTRTRSPERGFPGPFFFFCTATRHRTSWMSWFCGFLCKDGHVAAGEQILPFVLPFPVCLIERCSPAP